MAGRSAHGRTQASPREGGMAPFQLREHLDGAGRTLALSGELDMVSSPELETAISQACKQGAGRLVLDLSELTFMDLTGLRIVLFAKELCDWHRCEFALVPGPASVQRVFELTDMLDILPFASAADPPPRSAGLGA